MNLVSSFVRDKASQCLTHMNRTDETRKCSLVLDVESICRYSSYEAITKSFLARKPMGGFYLKDKKIFACLLYTSPSPRDLSTSRMPSSA